MEGGKHSRKPSANANVSVSPQRTYKRGNNKVPEPKVKNAWFRLDIRTRSSVLRPDSNQRQSNTRPSLRDRASGFRTASRSPAKRQSRGQPPIIYSNVEETQGQEQFSRETKLPTRQQTFYGARPKEDSLRLREIEDQGLNELNEALIQMQRDARPYCAYINSFRIKKALADVRAKGQTKDPCEVQAKSIHKLVMLHLRRMNVKARNLSEAPVIDLNELSRNEHIQELSIDQLHKESMQLQRAMALYRSRIRRARSGGWGRRQEYKDKPMELFRRKQEYSFPGVRRQTTLHNTRIIETTGNDNSQSIYMIANTIDHWLHNFSQDCTEELGENKAICTQ